LWAAGCRPPSGWASGTTGGIGGPPTLSPGESRSRSGCGTRLRWDWAPSGASSGLSCRAGHRWETIAFCPGASRARAAQGGRDAGLCRAPGAVGQGTGVGSCLPCPYRCPSPGLLEAPGQHRGLTSPRGTAALAKLQFACPCDSTCVCRSHTSNQCPRWLGKDPRPPLRVPKPLPPPPAEHPQGPSSGHREYGAIGGGTQIPEAAGREHGRWR